MCSAWRFCLSVYLVFSPRGMVHSPSCVRFITKKSLHHMTDCEVAFLSPQQTTIVTPCLPSLMPPPGDLCRARCEPAVRRVASASTRADRSPERSPPMQRQRHPSPARPFAIVFLHSNRAWAPELV